MNIKIITIDLQISTRAKRRLRIGAVGALLLSAGAAFASVPNTFSSGQTVSAALLNENFDSLDARIPLGASFNGSCGITAQTSPGWIQSTTAGTGADAGKCFVNFGAGRFSSAPICTATSYGANGATPRYTYSVRFFGAPTATQAIVTHTSVDTAIGPPSGALAAEPFAITCVSR